MYKSVCVFVYLLMCVYLRVCLCVMLVLLFLLFPVLWQQQNSPEDEYKENKKGKEDGDIVHGAQHDKELPAQIWHKADKLEDAQQTERAQYGQP